MLKNNVLRKQKDFDSLYKKGKSVGDRFVVVFYRKNRLDYNRTGFLASKKVGNAVKRNRARRLMKEAYRNLEKYLPLCYDFIIIARNTIIDKKEYDVERSLRSAFRRAGILEKRNV